MSGPLKVAGIGAGYFAAFHYDAWRRIPGVELVAIVDKDPERAKQAAARHGAAYAYADAARMLADAKPDIIDIITPPETHRGLVALAAEAGVAAICQKPLAPTYDEAAALVATADAAGITLIVHENFRFQPWYREARRLIDAGRLGELHAIAFRLRPGDGGGPDAYLARQPYFRTMPRFLVHETAIHFIDTFRFLMGEVTGVFARLRRLNPAIAGEDQGLILFEFEGGASGCFDGNRLNDFPASEPRLTMGEMLLEGADARLRLDGEGALWLKPLHQPERPHDYAFSTAGFGGDCVFALHSHIVGHFREGRPAENTGPAYLRNVAIEQAVYRAAEEGRWQSV